MQAAAMSNPHLATPIAVTALVRFCGHLGRTHTAGLGCSEEASNYCWVTEGSIMALEYFNPAIDRYDRRSATRLFRSLWPDAVVARMMAENLAASVRAANAAGDASWEVTMHPHGVRLNVGQVETLTLWEDGARFFFRSPLNLSRGHPFTVQLSDSPIYPSVPVPSGKLLRAIGRGSVPSRIDPRCARAVHPSRRIVQA